MVILEKNLGTRFPPIFERGRKARHWFPTDRVVSGLSAGFDRQFAWLQRI